jgi:hypothetical protein
LCRRAGIDRLECISALGDALMVDLPAIQFNYSPFNLFGKKGIKVKKAKDGHR